MRLGCLSSSSPLSLHSPYARTRSDCIQLIQHAQARPGDMRTWPSSSGQAAKHLYVVARANSSVPLHLRTTHSAPKEEHDSTGVSPIARRVIAGLVMGAIGATLVVQGGVLYLGFIEFFIFQAAQEYFGFITAVDKKEGIHVTPQWVVHLVTACCMALPLYSFISGGKIAIPFALASFVLLSAVGAGLKTPSINTLSSSMFGLLYCGVILIATIHARCHKLRYHSNFPCCKSALISPCGGLPHSPHRALFGPHASIARTSQGRCGPHLISRLGAISRPCLCV